MTYHFIQNSVKNALACRNNQNLLFGRFLTLAMINTVAIA